MCKPNMKTAKGSHAGNAAFACWENSIRNIASLSNTYMKISGGFSEIDPLPSQQEQELLDFWTRADSMRQISDWIMDWMDVVLAAFGPNRIIFGSDWPVCNMGGGGNGVAWKNVSLFSVLDTLNPNPDQNLETYVRGSEFVDGFCGPRYWFRRGLLTLELLVVVVGSKAVC